MSLENQQERFYGKYRGTVTDWVDPDKMGRIQATLVGTYGTMETGPANPCTPFAGNGVGFMFVPPEGAHVWVEFEGGDPSKPIYSGCFWNTKDEVPKDDDYSYPDSKIIKTNFATVILDANTSIGEKQNIVIKTNNTTSPESRITLTENEVELKLTTPTTILITSASVAVNGDALVVTTT
jgi:hypothetical protein